MPLNDGGLRPTFRKHLPQVHWTSIESALTGSGIPDTNGCFRGFEFWIEHKATDGYAVRLRSAQYAWGMRRARSEGRVFCAVRRCVEGGPRRGAACDDLWLIPVKHYPALFDAGLRPFLRDRPADVGHWTGGASEWDWKEVLARLIS